MPITTIFASVSRMSGSPPWRGLPSTSTPMPRSYGPVPLCHTRRQEAARGRGARDHRRPRLWQAGYRHDRGDDKSLVDSGLCQWILPDFTTTENVDAITATVLMMGTMQAYFHYVMSVSGFLTRVLLHCATSRGNSRNVAPERLGRLARLICIASANAKKRSRGLIVASHRSLFWVRGRIE